MPNIISKTKKNAYRRMVWFALAAAVALALSTGTSLVQAESIKNPIQAEEFKDVIAAIADWAVAIAVPLTVLAALYAAYLYLFSGGNPDRVKQAATALTWAVVGFIVVLLAKGLAELIQNILQVK